LALSAPYNYFGSYTLKAYYKGFTVYDEEMSMKQKKVDISLPLYDIIVDAKDELGLTPGVDVRPFLISSKMTNPLTILPEDIGSGRYSFKDLPAAPYTLEISYGDFSDEKIIDIPEIGDSTNIGFTAKFDLFTELFNSRGDGINDENLKMDIIRDGRTISGSIKPNEIVSLPPGNYTINVYSDGDLLGFKNIELTSDREIKIVTVLEPSLPVLITLLSLIFIGEIFVFLIFKKISLNTFLKLLAMALILLSLFQPWWVLNASSDNPIAEKNTNMFIVPQAMIDRTTYNDKPYLELATIPELFTNFLGVLLLIVCSGFVLLGLSFIPNIFLRRRFSIILISASILFFILVSGAFSVGMSKICEISLGSLQGEGAMNVVLPGGGNAAMSASWGLGIGFYLCILSALIATAAGLLDSFREGSMLKKLFTKK
ncbi:MAG: carboxypeptidase-like regulatory domain-containing protein, partial [Euryarchaeota archaeon]|nr:carboxypeptidase-like regulatory domain-containing protein [Euryarchaeota archaeon]